MTACYLSALSCGQILDGLERMHVKNWKWVHAGRELVPRFAPWTEDAYQRLLQHALPDGPIVVPCCGPGRLTALCPQRWWLHPLMRLPAVPAGAGWCAMPWGSCSCMPACPKAAINHGLLPEPPTATDCSGRTCEARVQMCCKAARLREVVPCAACGLA